MALTSSPRPGLPPTRPRKREKERDYDERNRHQDEADGALIGFGRALERWREGQNRPSSVAAAREEQEDQREDALDGGGPVPRVSPKRPRRG